MMHLSAAYIGYEFLHNAQYMSGMKSLCGRKTQLHYMEHHPAHAASAFLVSPFDEAALLTIDYIGEWAVTWSGIGRGTDIKKLRAVNYPNSLGVFYSALTDYLGFLRASDEYKVMGLASYGEPEYIDEFRKIISQRNDGWYDIDLSWLQCHYLPGSRCGYFSQKFIDRFGPKRKKGEPLEERHRNIAASVQRVLEESVLSILEGLHKETGLKKLCMAGGVALNSAMNGRIFRESHFDDIYIQPAAGDDGIAIGAAYDLYHRFSGKPRCFEMRNALIGPEYSKEQIKSFLDMAKVPYEEPANIEESAAALIAEGNIVGWYQGRMEYGPRALGSRSILADPTRPEMKDLLNKYVKHREDFRPFAPSCIEEEAHKYFKDCKSSPYMLFVYPVEEDKKDKVPAITHIDGTARVQTVSKDVNPRYYGLIREFEKLRGVPMVLNTSFNVMGEPIVNTPEDAVRCFYSCGMDALAIGDYLVIKK